MRMSCVVIGSSCWLIKLNSYRQKHSTRREKKDLTCDRYLIYLPIKHPNHAPTSPPLNHCTLAYFFCLANIQCSLYVGRDRTNLSP